MRTLYCDFQRRRPPSPLGGVLLVVGALVLGGAILAHQYLDEQTQAYAAKIRQAERSFPGAAGRATDARDAAATKANDAALAAARRALGQLNLPWSGLFAALESAENEDIALLSVTPDVRKGEVRIAAEARNLSAMLDFHRRLEASGQLRNLALSDHEIAAQDPLRPVRFNLVATWVTANARP